MKLHYKTTCIKAFIARELKCVRFSEQSIDMLKEWRKFTKILNLILLYSLFPFLTVSEEGNNSSFLDFLYSFTCSINYLIIISQVNS